MEIIDNINKTLKDEFKAEIKNGSKLSIAAACFSIYAYQELKEELESIDELRFIFTSPTFITDKAERTPKERREYFIPKLSREKSVYGTDFEVKLRNNLSQKAIARECADWIRKKAVFKSNATNEAMGGFINLDDKNYIPVNEFTTVGLGCEKGNNAYNYIQKNEAPMSNAYIDLFNGFWNDKERLQDVTEQVINNISTAYKENSPEFIYYITLYNIFSEFLDDISEDTLPNEAVGFKESVVWNKLYNFQKDAALAIINKLEKYNGCILADSVGLGKTFTALAVIKYYESRNKSVLVLCPKKLGENWNTYCDNYVNNILYQDRLNYNFNPLFSLNYSATHKTEHNMVYVLDALEAYNQKLVKKIEVKGFEVKNFRGTDSYLYLQEIVLSKNKPPMAKIELEIGYDKSINRETRILGVGDDLYPLSKNMEQYKDGYVISEIDPTRGTVTLLNSDVLSTGNVVGDVSENDMRRIQIRETILSHFEKEEKLFNKGIKTLSLFFIDEVAKYRQYDEDGNELLGEYGRIFEEEYTDILNDYLTLEDNEYQKYLRSMCSDASAVHKGYFSIDKKGRSIDSKLKRGSEFSDDISAYDLILKNKERLLSFDEPTRFIFSHSALREGWDNPNVFQICTLKHSDSQTAKRQEVGRGLRLCVNQDGNRMDAISCENTVHDINVLTVVASDSYKDFVKALQTDIKKVLYDRPTKATIEYFEGKIIKLGEEEHEIDIKEAKAIYRYLIKNDYIDDDDSVTDEYRTDLENNVLAPLPLELTEYTEGVHKLIQAIFDERVLDEMISDAHETKVKDNPLNDNFYKKEFQTLWNYINHKYAYTVHFDSAELIEKSVVHINDKLFVSELQYTTTLGEQKREMNQYEVERNASFTTKKSRTQNLRHAQSSTVTYDLIGKIAEGTTLTRKTVAAILKGIGEKKLYMFKVNPEEFINKVIKLIKEQKATMIVDHITYDQIAGTYDSAIFTAEKSSQDFSKAFKAEKHIQDYVFTDGTAEKSVERRFAEDLDLSEEVCVYAKLPKGFAIPTPVGNYSPDWAIAFNEGTVKHIYFVAETKGSMESMDLRGIEGAKIECAKKLFNNISTSKVRYDVVNDYQNLLAVVNSME